MSPVDTQELPRIQGSSVGTDKLTLVLMAGLPGAGKTKLAYALGDELKWPVINKDWYIIEELRERHLKDNSRNEEASRVAYDRSFKQVRTMLMEQNESVILDSAALHQFILKEAKKIMCDAPDARLKVILCLANWKLRRERLDKRKEPHPESIIDLNANVNDSQLFGHLPPDKLVLDTSILSFEEYLDKALDYIKR